MALIIEDGSCPVGATSYASLDEAEAYLVPRGLWPATSIEVDADAGTETTDAAMVAAKEAALARAFDYLNGPLEWLGEKICWQRGPAWPRVDVPVPGNDPSRPEFIPPDMIPEAVKRAQLELAAMIYKGNDLFAPVEHGGKIRSVSESTTDKVDVLARTESRSVTFADDAPVESWLPAVYPLLRDFLAELPGRAKCGFQVFTILPG